MDKHTILGGLESQPTTLDEALTIILEEAQDILVRKRLLRGHANITAQGMWGVLNRAQHDKLARVNALMERMRAEDVLRKAGIDPAAADYHRPLPDYAGTSADPDFIDDVLDAINYLVILLLMAHDWWELPLQAERHGRRPDLQAIGALQRSRAVEATAKP